MHISVCRNDRPRSEFLVVVCTLPQCDHVNPEMERELTIERTRVGLEVARQLGRKGGRKWQMTESKIKSDRNLLASGVPPRDVAANLGIAVPNRYRWIRALYQPL